MNDVTLLCSRPPTPTSGTIEHREGRAGIQGGSSGTSAAKRDFAVWQSRREVFESQGRLRLVVVCGFVAFWLALVGLRGFLEFDIELLLQCTSNELAEPGST